MFKLKNKVNVMEMRLRSLEKEVHDIHSSLLFGTKPEPIKPCDAPLIDMTTTRLITGDTSINMKIHNMSGVTWKNFEKELSELVSRYGG